MSESRTECEICARAPGEYHSMDCPRWRRVWRAPFDWLAYSKLPITPPKRQFRGFFQDAPKPSFSPGKWKRWRLAPIDKARALKPAAMKLLAELKRAAR